MLIRIRIKTISQLTVLFFFLSRYIVLYGQAVNLPHILCNQFIQLLILLTDKILSVFDLDLLDLN